MSTHVPPPQRALVPHPQTALVLAPTASVDDPMKQLRRLFNQVYSKWSRREEVDEGAIAALSNFDVSEEQFLALTGNREFSKYIALIDYRVRFDDIPLRPHGQIIGYMSEYLAGVFQTTSPANVLFAAGDNGMASSF
jgi:hypothetical protein